MQIMRALIAIVLANLPLRWWPRFEEHFPLSHLAWVSGLAMLLAGCAMGIAGFLAFLEIAAGGLNQALVDAQSDLVQLRGPLLLSLPVFLFTTPTGLASMYLAVSGLVRFAAALIADDPHGDWILTAADRLVFTARHDLRDWNARKTRERLEGSPLPDRLVTGEWLARPEIDLAIVASRRRDWPCRAYLVTADGTAYRVGDAFDLDTAAGLRTVYPLTELKTGEAIRHAIPYDLPPLWRSPFR